MLLWPVLLAIGISLAVLGFIWWYIRERSYNQRKITEDQSADAFMIFAIGFISGITLVVSAIVVFIWYGGK